MEFWRKQKWALIVVVGLIIILGVLLLSVHNRGKSETTKSTNPTTVYFSPTTALSQYSSSDYSFSYPKTFENFKMVRYFDDTNLETHSYYHATYDYSNNAMPFGIVLYPTGYAVDNELVHIHADQNKFNLDSTPEEIEALNGNFDQVIGYKKLDDLTGLLIEYSNDECSPNTSVEVIAPVKNSDKFSNFRVMINLPELDNISPSPEDQCDLYGGFKIIADSIMNATASQSIKDQIALGQKIAESFVVSNKP